MEIIMPVGGSGYNFNNNLYSSQAITEHNSSSTTDSNSSAFDFNNYSISYPSSSSSHSQIHQADHQRLGQSTPMPNQSNRSKENLDYPTNEQTNSNFTSSVQFNQPRSGPLSNSQVEYSSYNFQFPSNSYQSNDYSNYSQQQQQQQQQHYQQPSQPLRSPLPPAQYSQVQTPTNVLPQNQYNSNFQYSSSHDQESSNDHSPLYPPRNYQQQHQTSYFPQYSEKSKSFTFNDPFANRSRPDGKLEEFTDDDVQILKSLLFNGEKIKWKYVSSKLANVTGRRATSSACSKKTRELFRLPSEKDCGDLGTSLPYVIHNSWKSLEKA